MHVPDLAAVREATAGLVEQVTRLDDLTAASLLPGWTRAHVLAHLAGNARSHVRMLAGARSRVLTSQYAGGGAARAEAIDALAARPEQARAECLVSCAELAEAWAAMSPADWEQPVLWLDGDPEPAWTTAWAREKEVEVHRVDLGAGHTPADWSWAFADRLLDHLLARLPVPGAIAVQPTDGAARDGDGPVVRGSTADLAAWLYGRAPAGPVTADGGVLPRVPEWR